MGNFNKKISHFFNKKANKKISVIEINKHCIHIIDPENSTSLDLLKKAYKEIYEPAFPIKDEREELDTWLENLADKTSTMKRTIILTGENFNSKDLKITGISVSEYYPAYDVGLLSYNAISQDSRNQGLGRTMVDARKHALFMEARKNGKNLKGIFVDCNNPEKVSPEEDIFNPTLRIKIFEKWGASLQPLTYVQPPLEKGSHKCDFLQIFAYPHPKTSQYPTPDALESFITALYKESEQYMDTPIDKDPDYINMMAEIKDLKKKMPPQKIKPFKFFKQKRNL